MTSPLEYIGDAERDGPETGLESPLRALPGKESFGSSGRRWSDVICRVGRDCEVCMGVPSVGPGKSMDGTEHGVPCRVSTQTLRSSVDRSNALACAHLSSCSSASRCAM